MIVERVRAERFRNLGSLDIRLGPGLTVIRGRNEAGKSSLLEAILVGLWGQEQRLELLTTWGADAAPWLSLTLRADREVLELTRDFAAGRAELREESTGLVTRDADAVVRRIGRLLGAPTRAFFESTACVRQEELLSIQKDPAALAQAVEGLVTGPEDVAAEAAVRELRRHRAELGRGLEWAARDPGAVVRARREVERLEAAREQVAAAAAEREHARSHLKSLEREADEARAEVERLERTRANGAEALSCIEESRRLRTRAEALESATALAAELRALGEDTPAEAREDADTARRLQEQVRALESLPRPDPNEGKGRVRVLLALGGLLTGLGVGLGVFVDPIGVVGVVFGLACLVAALLLSRARQGATDAVGERIAELRREAEAVATRRGFQTPTALIEAQVRAERNRSDRNALRTRLERALERDPDDALAKLPADLASARDGLERQLARLRKLSEGGLPDEVLALMGDTAGDVDAARLAIARLAEQFDTAERRVRESERRIAELRALLDRSGPEDELTAVEGELARAKEHLAGRERRLAAVDVAIEGLGAARRSVLARVGEELAPAASKRFERVTDGKYSQIRLDPRSFEITVVFDGRDVRPDALSSGARDQLYLATRLAMAELLCDGRHPPLLVDDALASFDEARADRMMQVLRDASRDHQVVIFSWSDRHDRFADRVIDLERRG